MPSRFYLLLLFGLLFAQLCLAGTENLSVKEERHMEVSMRMIGHQVLLAVGDTSSLVLPVEKYDDQYKIRFGTKFGFDPESLAATIDSVVRETQIAKSYIVEFVSCDSNLVVYSYEVGESEKDDLNPCIGRAQVAACYDLLITILDTNESQIAEVGGMDQAGPGLFGINNASLILLLLLVLLLTGTVATFLKRRPVPISDPNLVKIGGFLFNKRNMELSIENDRIGLTSKEADLLQLLSASLNDTVEREDILKNVWGDEGDYVGRTLDVFISKLRKKLEADSNVKIVNIRGIGYKLVLQN